MLIVNGVFYASPITIAICPINNEKILNVDIVNQLQVSESVIEKNEWNEEKINELDLQISDYNLTFEFTVATIHDSIIDLLLGSN